MNLRFDHVERAPVLIVGAGVAGLSAALAMNGSTVLTCGNLGEGGSTAWAQGGVAAAMDAEDTAADHARDTLRAGAGIVDEEAVRHLTESAPAAIRWMLELGARFDRDPSGSLALSREGGHGRRRVVHADGDATGIEILRTLTEAAKRRPDVRMVEQARAVDLAMADCRVVGV
ncbi:MAG TPA: FAD-binding protein, partial [Fimbriimonadaceae bacterium]|nr:FAD-binding protein [Fimbriimonadaceae bacterium]